ncbi:MAG: ThiF family adenylyltransferase [Planctomyces sp.]|jgi:tRNA A37 threonylcarbamoyladenosine dehydratase
MSIPDSISLDSDQQNSASGSAAFPEDTRNLVNPELNLTRSGNRTRRPWEQPLPSPAHTASPAVSSCFDDGPIVIHRRWDRLVRLLGNDGVRRLLGAHVAVFGLGGVGSYVAESLARSAVGRLSLIDFDDVCVTNVNRQLQAFPATIGKSKALLMAERVRAIHPEVAVSPIQAFYSAETSEALLTPRPDFVVDAIDNVTSKILLLKTCLERGIPVVSVSGAGARLDPTLIRVTDLARTKVDPLARVIRKELNRQRGASTATVATKAVLNACSQSECSTSSCSENHCSPSDLDRPGETDTAIRDFGIPVVYSEEEVREPLVPEWDVDSGFQCICPHRADSPHACEKRRVIYGTASFMTAAFGMAAASVVIRSLSKTEASGRDHGCV